MLPKASRRGGSYRDAKSLLDHLLRGAENERILEVDGPGMLADLINDARAITSRPHAVWHMSLNPLLPLTPAQWKRAREVVLDGYGAPPDLPTVYVEHVKGHRQRIRNSHPPRPDHRHLVFPTQDPITGRQIDPYRHYAVNERIARQLEFEFGHPLTPGAHSPTVHRLFLANGKVEIAKAMEAAGLLAQDPSQAKVTDRERNLARRTGRDPFAAADAAVASMALAVKCKEQAPGAAFRQSLADEGFVLARGGRRLLLVPMDGGKPVSAARKAGKKESEIRELLGSEMERLPILEPDQDVAAWLRALGGQAPTPTNTGDHDGRTRTEDDPGLDRGQAGRDPRRRRPGRAPELRPEGVVGDKLRGPGRPPRDPPRGKQAGGAREAQHAGGKPDRPVAPARPDLGDGDAGIARRSESEQPRPRPDASPERRRTTRFEQARLTRITEQHLGRHRETIAGLLEQVRRPPDPDRVQAVAGEIVAARRHAAQRHAAQAAQDVQIREPSPAPVRGIELASAERGADMVDERKRVWILVAIRKRYDTGWLPPAVVEHIVDYQYDRRSEEVVLTLDTGARIRDGMTQILLEGQVDEIGVTELVAAVQRRGWQSVNLTGDLAFQRAAALRLALLDPPVGVVGSQLSPGDIERVEKRVAELAAADPSRSGIRI